MPHTSRKNHHSKNTNASVKRLQITSDDGWTHVTTNSKEKNFRRRHHTKANVNSKSNNGGDNDNEENDDRLKYLVPAEEPRGMTIEELKVQFESYRLKWADSETCRALRETLSSHCRPQETETETDENEGSKVDNIICIGLGSPSGFLRGGWVDRRSVSMYQLAALTTIIDVIGENKKIYAQDPVFNTLDKSLLLSLGITVLDHPAAFDLVSPATFLCCPGAERSHLDQLLQHNPSVLFGGPLEDTESEVLKRFCAERSSRRLPVFENLEHAFWEMRVYYRSD